MKTSTTITTALAGVLTAVVLLTGSAMQSPAGAAIRMSHAFESTDSLIAEFLRALEKDDADALRRLRVTEAEYREILLPGSVREGQPLRHYTKEVADFAWGNLDTRSRYHELALLQGYRGRHFAVKAVDYDKGVGRYANHTAYRQLRLTLDEPNAGKEVRLGTGSIVEIDGRYKFISFIND